MNQYSKRDGLYSQGTSKHSSDLSCEHSVILELEKACNKSCSSPKVMTDDELINNLFPESIF